MASRNQVTLTFAGDHDKLTESFDEVGTAADRMEGKVDDAAAGFDTAADRFDDIDTKAMGFRDTITGVQDSVKGFGQVLKGDFSGDALLTAGTGVGDLASGFTNLLVPSLKSAWGWLAQTRAGMLAQAAASGVVSAATKVWTGIQAAFNFVMALNPVVLIIAAILILIGVIVLIATKTDWFQRIWAAVWNVIGDPVKKVWDWIKNTLWPGIQRVWQGIVDGVKMVWRGISTYFGFWKGIIDKVMRWVGDIPGRIGRAFRGLGDAISAPFRNGFDAVKRFWNNTIGGKGFDIPSWVPGVGGKSFRFPVFHRGGIVPGAPGQEVMAILQAGERVTPAGQAGSQPVELTMAGGSALERMFLAWLQDLLRRNNLRLVAG